MPGHRVQGLLVDLGAEDHVVSLVVKKLEHSGIRVGGVGQSDGPLGAVVPADYDPEETVEDVHESVVGCVEGVVEDLGK